MNVFIREEEKTEDRRLVLEPAAEPAAEPATQPAAEPAGEPAAQPAATEDPIEENIKDEDKDKDESATKDDVEEDTAPKNKKCVFVLDIMGCICLYLMSIFFLCGASFIHPDTYFDSSRPKEPYSFWLIGVLFYVTIAIIEVVKSVPKKKVMRIVNTLIVLFGGVLWFVGSIFLFSSTLRMGVWAALWLVGTMLNLYVITYDLVILFIRNDAKSLFRTIALALSWLANLMFFAGSAYALKLSNSPNFLETCEERNLAGLLISGAMLYLIHAVFYTLALFKGNITFSVQISSS